MSVQVAVASEPLAPRSSLYTCLACQVAFHSSEKQRNHYRTDWHKYNLKRKVADLNPITAEQFAQKVLAQQARGREEEERHDLVYDCILCQKTYRSEQAFTNHVQSKKHKEMELKADELHKLPQSSTAVNNGRLLEDDDDSVSDIHSQASRIEHIDDPEKDCLFCRHHALEIEENLKHMEKAHGFFVPDPDYLKDTSGLLHHLTNKLVQEHLCLYCNGRGREYRSLEAVRAHMIDCGHCKVSFETIGDLEEVIEFYDYDLSVIENDMEIDASFKTRNIQSSELVETELILPSGTRIGHRSFNVYYRQSLRPVDARESVAANRLLTENGEGIESLSKSQRKRMNQLAITNGSSSAEQQQKSLQSIKQRQRFQLQMGVRNNGLMKHYRLQNPV
ncbi:C2H2 type zinc-finger-domain-containing protein [Umbelopsis sp. PMI_123]|nr:C2H2 type zinc-finger-domain-containing protein [Umbelopsis sp. PMI_123]